MAATSTPTEGSALRSFLATEMGEDVETGAEAPGEKASAGRTYTRPNGQIYVGRQVPRNEAGIGDDVELLRALRAAGVFPRLMSAPGTGKLLPLETPIPTPEGWKTMGEIECGDEVIGRDGRPTTVTFVSETEKRPELYDIRFSDGSVITACADHQWTVTTRAQRLAARESRRKDMVARRRRVARRQKRLLRLAVDGPLGKKASARELLMAAREVEDLPWASAAVLQKYLRREGVQYEVRRHPVRQVTRRTGKARTNYVKVALFEVVAALKAMASYSRSSFSWVDEGELPEKVMTTREMLECGVEVSGEQRLQLTVRMSEPLVLPDANLPVDPYVLGVWLGDGHVRYEVTARVTSADAGIVNEVIRAGYDLRNITADRRGNKASVFTFEGLGSDLAKAGVAGKRIPMKYLRSGAEQRMALLAGLMDTDGTISRNGGCELTLSDEGLARDAEELLHSLGIKVRRKVSAGSYRDSEGAVRRVADRHRMHFTTTLPVFRLRRKAERIPKKVRATTRWLYIAAITPAKSRPGRCIQVDNAERMYLCGREMIPTHNTAAMEAAFGEELITVVCGEGTDEDSLVGGHRPRPGGEWEWVDGPVTRAMTEGRPLLLDEFAAAHPRVQSRLNGVFDGRLELQLPEKDGGEVVHAADGFWAAVAYNPGPHFELSEAMASRFALPIRYTTDLRVARAVGVPEKAVKLTRRLRRMVSAGEASWQPEMRELVAFRDHEALLGEGWAVGALIGAAPEECREEVAAACAEVFCGIAAKELEL